MIVATRPISLLCEKTSGKHFSSWLTSYIPRVIICNPYPLYLSTTNSRVPSSMVQWPQQKYLGDIPGVMNPEPTHFKGQKHVKTHSLLKLQALFSGIFSKPHLCDEITGRNYSLLQDRMETSLSLEGTFEQRFEYSSGNKGSIWLSLNKTKSLLKSVLMGTLRRANHPWKFPPALNLSTFQKRLKTSIPKKVKHYLEAAQRFLTENIQRARKNPLLYIYCRI